MAAELGAGTVEARDAFGNLLLVDDQRRQQPHDIVAGGDGNHLLGAQRIDELTDRNERAQADQEPFAADLGDQRRIAVFDLGQALLE